MKKYWQAFLYNNGLKNTVLIQNAKSQISGKRNWEMNINDRFSIFLKWEKNSFQKDSGIIFNIKKKIKLKPYNI